MEVHIIIKHSNKICSHKKPPFVVDFPSLLSIRVRCAPQGKIDPGIGRPQFEPSCKF
jgi:hypothetical protein